MNKTKPENIKPETKAVYDKLYKRNLTNQEAFEANHNLLGFFNVLLQINKRVNKPANNVFDFSQSRQYSNAKQSTNNYHISNEK